MNSLFAKFAAPTPGPKTVKRYAHAPAPSLLAPAPRAPALLAALTTLFGMQTLRALLPLLLYVLRDRFGWSAPQIGLLALGLFALAFLAAPLNRRLGTGRALLLTAGGLGLLRLALQGWRGDPLVDLGLALAGVALFLLWLPLALGRARAAGALPAFAVGLLLGGLLDLALHGAYDTLDLAWQPGRAALLLTALLVAAQAGLLGAALRAAGAEPAADGPAWRAGLPWLALGPYLFLQIIVYQNVARLGALTGWPPPLALAWALLATAVTTLAAPAAAPGLRRTGALHGATALLLVLLTFLFYSGYDLALPFGVELLPPAAALLTAVALGLGLAPAPQSAAPAPLGLAPAYPALLTALLLLIPAFKLLPAPPSAALPAAGPVRLLTYNLHNGFDPTGYLGMEALAQAIEASGADVVALQEVSRGWAVNGALDMAAWLSQRLGMPYLFGPTADPLWGNALLSRYPIRAAGAQPLPPDDLLLRRGLLWAEIDVGTTPPLTVIVTHFHHPPDGGAVRARQAQALLDFWQGRPRTALLGDFNAHAGDAELALLRDAGLIDAWAAVQGDAPGYTFSSTTPFERIDYVWLTPDLTPTAAAVLPDRASDHLPLVVEVGE